MDFFERQDASRRSTRWLLAYFGVGVVMLVLAVYLAVMLIFSVGRAKGENLVLSRDRYQQTALWNARLFLWVAGGTLAVVGLGTLNKMRELSNGGSAVAEMLGGHLVLPDTRNADERKLLNVVEEMAIAAGIPVPQVYILPGEAGINAFAAGYSTSDAAVAVTGGALKTLSRDELQGVVAHEFSHILNGDMRLNIRLISLVFGIMCLAVVGRILLETRSSGRSRDRNPLPLLGLALLLIGWVGGVFGRLMQCAISRQREFLADAAAVQFTRNPVGLAGALKKIGGASCGSSIQSSHAMETAHLFFGSTSRRFGWFDTHPSLFARIRLLDPQFDGVFPSGEREVSLRAEGESVQTGLHGLEGGMGNYGGISASGSIPPVIGAGHALSRVGVLSPGQVRYAEDLRLDLPPELREGARQPLVASCIVYALLLSEDAAMSEQQLCEVERLQSQGVVAETRRILPFVRSVTVRARLPLIDLVVPTLKLMSFDQFKAFSATLDRLIECDEQVDMLEYTLRKVVERHVAPRFSGARRSIVQYYAIKALVPDCAVLLSALADCGAGDEPTVRSAFARGAEVIAQYARADVGFPVKPEDRGLQQIDEALNRISLAAPQIKKNVLLACAHTVAADGVIHEVEAELLRTIADSLDCPFPPFLPA